MEIFFVYAGRKGSNLECALSLYGIAKSLGADAKLILSKDNDRAYKVSKLYPEAEFYDFMSIPELFRLKKRLESGVSLFTMVSPKMFPLFLSLKSKKIFYFHATYDYSFSTKGINDRTNDFMHDRIISNSTLTVATQWPLAWQIRSRLGIEAEVLPHPPYSAIRKGFFSEDEPAKVPFKRFFLDFGGLDRFSKGTDVLLNAAKGAKFNTVLAGRAGKNFSSKNVLHLDRWVDDGELHNLIKRSEAVVLPYLVSSQFSGCMALAFHFGIPVVAPFSSAFEGWIDEGKTGWFFSSGDFKDLRRVLDSVWSGKAKHSKAAIAKKEREMELRTRQGLKEIIGKVM
jgi:glycosyltransferase involved in cell wall biosynthesis